MLGLSPDGAHQAWGLTTLYYIRRQINLYVHVFRDFSVNSQPILEWIYNLRVI